MKRLTRAYHLLITKADRLLAEADREIGRRERVIQRLVKAGRA